MLALKVEWRLAVFGALSFGFSTYLIIIFVPGHNAKAHAIAYMPLVLAGVLWIFRRKYVLGFIVTAIAMALEVYANHIQMTYYFGFCLFILGIVKLINSLQKENLQRFLKQSAVIIAAIVLGVAANAPRLMAMKEYADYSTRGKSELTINPDGSKKEATVGLDKDYITQYSYAKLETFNLFVPRYMGGGTVEKLDSNSNFYKLLQRQYGKKAADAYSENALTYWGDQIIIEAPAYIGAVLFFLFFLGIFIVKGPLKQWLVAATVFSILMSWGRNFEFLTNLFIDYFPLYNKFRAVSSIQVIAELCVPILAVLALQEFFKSDLSKKEKLDGLKKAIITFGGLIIAGFVLAHASSTFQGLRDVSNYQEVPGLIDALIEDRKAMLLFDSIRSLIFGLLSAGILWMLLQNKVKKTYAILGFAVLVLADLIPINKNYVSEDEFMPSRRVEKPFQKSAADELILKDKTHFRVGNFTVNPMEDGTTSYFHQSIGGYHAAKMGRYKELFDYQIAKNNMEVLNMLNTKYFIVNDDKGNKRVQQNPDANGNAWFVNTVIEVGSANKEMQALDSLKTKNAAVINVSKLEPSINLQFEKDSTASISLTSYKVTELTYESSSVKDQFAVFSEIFYEDGWNAYVDGELTPHYQVNYVLRGMKVPAGKHEIVFKFEPQVIYTGSIISTSAYILLLLVGLGWIFYDNKQKKKALKN